MGETFGKTSEGLSGPQARNRNLVKLGATATGSVLSGQPADMNSITLSKASPFRTLKQRSDKILSRAGTDIPAPDMNIGAPTTLPDLYAGQTNMNPQFGRRLPFYGAY